MTPSVSLLLLETERLTLQMPPPSVAGLVLDYYARNTAHLAPWDPPRPDAFLTLEYWRDRLARSRREFAEGLSVRLFIFERGKPGRIVGSVNTTNIVRGAFQAANVGYSFDASMQGQGYMTEALREVVRFSFQDFGLHRLMAGYMPRNLGSGRVLEKLGFEKEGQAKDFLFIAGTWEDHILTALTNPDFQFPDEEKRDGMDR